VKTRQAILIFVLGFALTGAVSAPVDEAVHVIRPTKWTYSCLPENVGADGQILCQATYLSYPSLSVERTDRGMKLSFVSQCGYNKNPNKLGKYIFQKFVVPVTFSPPASDAKQIAVGFGNALAELPAISRKACGSEHGLKRIKIDEDQIEQMIEVVFIQKKLPY
jgi:hypothetical protein